MSSLALALLLAAAPAAAPTAAPPKPLSTYQQREGKGGHGMQGARPAGAKHGAAGQHGNPADLTAYAAGLLDAKRDAWQKPDEVVKALGLAPGQVACDVGAGPGYFTLRLAAALGPTGRVYAVDVEPALLGKLKERLAAAGVRTVTPVLGLADDPLLPPGSCDLVLVVDTFHHFPDGVAYLWRLAGALRPGGRIVNIDFHKRETPVGPPVAHRVAREDFLAAATSAGLVVVAEPTFLEHQYFVVLAPAGAAAPTP
ncbi:MAG: class I SAM-dependent methyltransferase [Anaeromyxobacter sp.]|nr:class I SAM-dependent methyltransferase [Anaeromyxobacter sp.]